MLAKKRKMLYGIIFLVILPFLLFNAQTIPVSASSSGTTHFLGIDDGHNSWNVYFVYINTPKTFRVRFNVEDSWSDRAIGMPSILIEVERPDGTVAERFNVPRERDFSKEFTIQADQTGVWKVTVRHDPLLHLTGHFGCRYYIDFLDVNDQVWVTSLTSIGERFNEYDLWLEVSEAKLITLNFEGFHQLGERSRGRIIITKPDGSIVFDGEPTLIQDPEDEYHRYMKVYTIASQNDIGMWKIHIEEGYWGWYRIATDRDEPMKLFLETETGSAPTPPAGVRTEWGKEGEETIPFLLVVIIVVLVGVGLTLFVRRKRRRLDQASVVESPVFFTSPTSKIPPGKTTPMMSTVMGLPIELLSIKRGYETAGQYLKVGIKVENTLQTSITDVSVKIDVPAALEKVNPKTGIVELGVIKPGGSQSGNFQLRPIRCVDDIITGIIMFHDASGKLHTQEMKPLEIKSVCPMLTGEEVDVEWILMTLKKGKIKSNKASFKFDGDPKIAFAIAESRVRGLIQIDRDERFFEDGNYIAYSSYIGRTKYGDFDFAVEITATGQYGQGLLTLSVYSNEEAILSGFFYEVLEEVKKSVEITKEKVHVAEKICPECGAKLDMGRADDEGYLNCEFCDTYLRLAAWERKKEST